MIDIESYTCAICNALVDVQGIQNPKITWSCGHDGCIVHANLRGRLFSSSAVQSMLLKLSDIPVQHRDDFEAKFGDSAFVRNDERLWPYSCWAEYIEKYHRQQAEASR